MISIRIEEPDDLPAVRAVNERAFRQPTEANVVDKLRQTCDGLLSLVAVDEVMVVGHVLFSPVTVECDDRTVCGMGLAPMAVLPECQRRGIGAALISRGLNILKDRDCPFVIVLGHPEYYPRFGFETASRYGIRSQWNGVPREAFMILVFNQVALNGCHGVVRYRDEFDEPCKSNNRVRHR